MSQIFCWAGGVHESHTVEIVSLAWRTQSGDRDKASSGLREACAVGSQGGSPLAGGKAGRVEARQGNVH